MNFYLVVCSVNCKKHIFSHPLEITSNKDTKRQTDKTEDFEVLIKL